MESKESVVCEYLNETEVAILLGISRATVEKWRIQGRGPGYVKLGRCVRYSRVELERFIDRNAVATKGSAS